MEAAHGLLSRQQMGVREPALKPAVEGKQGSQGWGAKGTGVEECMQERLPRFLNTMSFNQKIKDFF